MAQDQARENLSNLDKETLITMLLTANSTIEVLKSSIKQLNKNISLLTEEVAGLRQARFGRKSEKNLSGPDNQYVMIFNEAEVTFDLHHDGFDPTDKQQEPEIEEITYKRKKPVGKRKADLRKIQERVDVPHELSEEELREQFPDEEWTRLPDVIYERVEMIPAKLKVYVHHVAVYKGKTSGKFVKAPRPKDLLRNCIATAGFVAAVANAKFVNAIPVNRLSDEIERIDNVRILPQNMCFWLNACADRYLDKLYNRLREERFRCHVMQADETPCLVNKDDRPAGSKSYM